MKFTRLLFLLSLSLLCQSVALAQSDLAEKYQRNLSRKGNLKIRLLEGANPDIPLASTPLPGSSTPLSQAVSFREGSAYSIPIGSSYNPYSVISEGPNPLSYHPAINALIFAHRQNYPHPGGSGIISFDLSTDGGVSWDTITRQITPSLITAGGTPIDGNRYPNGAIYNPTGNTDPANAYVISTGAALWTDPVYGSGWGWEFVASSKFDGSEVDEAYYTTQDSNIYLGMGMVYHPDGSIWYANYRREENLSHQLYNPMIATQLTFNSATNSFVRTAQLLPMNYSSGVDSFAVNPRIEFSPDGQTGYFVTSGIDGDDDEIYPSVKPIIWKSTDAGASWVKQPRVHWQEMDSLLAYTYPIDGDGDGVSDDPEAGSPRVPYLSMFDITVDKDSRLHIFGSMVSASDTATNATDFGFVWIGVGSKELFHFITDGQEWEHYRVDDWYNDDAPIGSEVVDERVQASRTSDGAYVFFTYCKSFYEELSEDNINSAPDIYGYAYRVEDGYIVDPKNYGWAPGTDFFDFEFTDVAVVGYFHMLAPVSITDGEDWDYELPIVYGIPQDVNSDLAPIDFYYLRAAGFDEGEFHERGVMVGAKNLEATQSFTVFPNPAKERVFVEFSFPQPTNYRVSLLNLLGQTLTELGRGKADASSQRLSFDTSQFSPGMYLVQVQAGERADTRKLIIR
ncbi:MAG: T9SS type A sorting domain-containing protein [Phaeodactylibacter sp.]|nr:T9SS type A sorting domain-containing protein [Phaeodactylibacter sp.]